MCAENNPHPLGLSPKEAMSLYDSRQRLSQVRRVGKYSVSKLNSSCTTLQSKLCIPTPYDRRLGITLGMESNALKQQLHESSDFEAFDILLKEEKKPKIEDLIANNTNNCSSSSSIDSTDEPKAKIAKLMPKDEPNDSGSDAVTSSAALILPTSNSGNVTTPAVPGGYESNEDYTYVRGRGRGRYVCSECGIRCKKPSMLKKHIRTHSDVRPYTCTNCDFR